MITCVHAFGERAVSRKYEMCMRVKGRSGIYNGSRRAGNMNHVRAGKRKWIELDRRIMEWGK